uniref:Uncharacterized protein n=1 Tax=Anguilla anguilla TaxID=7936 RepID=A0A0E9QGX7_ANGAN
MSRIKTHKKHFCLTILGWLVYEIAPDCTGQFG